MLTSMLWFVLAMSFVAAAVVGFSAYGAKRWREASRTLIEKLEVARIDAAVRPFGNAGFDSCELEGLPAPVQRYFRAALREGQPVVSAVDVELAGTFNLSASEEKWKPFTSRQRVVIRPPGFLWDAVIAMLPGVGVCVRDSYVAGEGRVHAAVLGLFTMADVHGGGEIARGELMRFLAEAAWYPTALLPSQGVNWDAVDERSANATFADGGLALTLLFKFNDADLIESVRAEVRGAMVGKSILMIPWEGRWSDYQLRDGMTVPLTGEVAWLWPEGRRAYFRARVTSLRYDNARGHQP
jgi:hypothetical protein